MSLNMFIHTEKYFYGEHCLEVYVWRVGRSNTLWNQYWYREIYKTQFIFAGTIKI